MNSEQMITAYLDSYRSLCRQLGQDDPRVVEAFGKLRDLIIVEIYFMKPIRYLISDEEMSGFVIFVIDDIKCITDKYIKSIGPFLTFLGDAMEKRAFTYLAELSRQRSTHRTYLQFQSIYSLAVSEKSPENVCLAREEAAETRKDRACSLQKLRYLCDQNPDRVRKLFTFLCTLMPFVSIDVIDSFCTALNCDRSQTLIICERIKAIQSRDDVHRRSRYHMSKVTDFHWEKILENEGKARTSLNAEGHRKKADFHRDKLQQALSGFKNAKMNVPYRTICAVLNMSQSEVALYVMHAKHLLVKVLSESPTKRMLDRFRSGEIRLPRFEPFLEFGILHQGKKSA